jgi:glycine C-acetyltransferase
MGFDTQIGEALAALESAGLLRSPRRVSGPQGPEIEIDGRRVLCFCSNNYLGLAAHPTLAEAAIPDATADGLGSGASRLITGTMDAHLAAEAALADFASKPTAALFANGYTANVGAIQALVGAADLVFSDALNHASLIDGCRLSRATTLVYRHGDVAHLHELLRKHRADGRRALIVSDSLFSMDGDLAPVSSLRALADEYEAGLFIDEAHALGVLGPEGRGHCAAEGVTPDVLVGTLGKSFGVAGAFVAASEPTVALVRNRARSYVFSTAPPPLLARAAISALPLVRAADDARRTLLAHAHRLRTGLRDAGYEVPDGSTQILPVLIGPNERTMTLSHELLERGIFVQGIRPPTVPEGTARLRLTPMATHRPEHIERAIEMFAAVAQDN